MAAGTSSVRWVAAFVFAVAVLAVACEGAPVETITKQTVQVNAVPQTHHASKLVGCVKPFADRPPKGVVATRQPPKNVVATRQPPKNMVTTGTPVLFGIIDVPIRDCPDGMKQDLSGRCREAWS